MNRVAVLVFASGCQVVFPLDPDGAPSVCGRYHETETLEFDGVDAVSDFSVDQSGVTGFVMARRNGDVRLTPIIKQGDVWQLDMARLLDLDTLHDGEGVRVGRSSLGGDLYVAKIDLARNLTRVFRYAKFGTMWVAMPNQSVSPASTADTTTPGGAIEINDGLGADRFFRHVPILHESETLDHLLVIQSSFPDTPNDWVELRDDAGKLATDAINLHHEVSQASLAVRADNSLVMAYAANVRGEKASKLYMSPKEDLAARYALGAPINELDRDGDVVEPFLADGCATLYFRRGNDFIKAEVVPE